MGNIETLFLKLTNGYNNTLKRLYGNHLVENTGSMKVEL